ncbi:MAG TPA: glycosyl hydrolase family 28-related protein, partial [Candidatus Saccharimonadaceae bacterium]|nr:glycosyl hydrolase family 28-related protein [Candidatus Saccharimonadaceae bacterium]
MPGSDDGQWGTLLNDFILAERNSDGSLKIRSDGTLANMYKMPTGGIPNSDLAASVQSAISASASAVQPTDTVAGDLSGTVLAPTVSSIAGVKLSGTPNSGNILSATSSAGAAWVKPYGDLEVFNVRDFGAVGDGVTDDTAAVLSAVAAAKAAGAGVVYLPNGTYGVSATILIDVDGVALVGAQTDENAGGVGSTIAALSTFSG